MADYQIMRSNGTWGELRAVTRLETGGDTTIALNPIDADYQRAVADGVDLRPWVDAPPTLANYRRTAQSYLDATDKRMLPDWPYPDDQPAWRTFRDACRVIVRLPDTTDPTTITLPEPPFAVAGLTW